MDDSTEVKGPIYQRPCALAAYIGADGPRDGEPRANVVDVYRCPGGGILRCFGSRPDLLRRTPGASPCRNEAAARA